MQGLRRSNPGLSPEGLQQFPALPAARRRPDKPPDLWEGPMLEKRLKKDLSCGGSMLKKILASRPLEAQGPGIPQPGGPGGQGTFLGAFENNMWRQWLGLGSYFRGYTAPITSMRSQPGLPPSTGRLYPPSQYLSPRSDGGPRCVRLQRACTWSAASLVWEGRNGKEHIEGCVISDYLGLLPRPLGGSRK